VRGLCTSFVDSLAALHTLDYEAAGLADLGKPDGYVERQVLGWSKRYESAKTDNVPAMDRMAAWLCERMPPERGAGLVHNDYKYDNVQLDPHDLTRIVSVFDWEMATLGDPLMDLGSTLAYWIEADDPPFVKETAFGPTALSGSFTRKEFVARYEESAGRDVNDVLFYYVYGLFKLAVIIQQIYARYARGSTSDARFASLNQRVQSIAATGVHAIDAGTI
jgi:aminoglycoside phosphotransferase (APT) family kinase protein